MQPIATKMEYHSEWLNVVAGPNKPVFVQALKHHTNHNDWFYWVKFMRKSACMKDDLKIKFIWVLTLLSRMKRLYYKG